jgi:hypothetical protein
MPIEGNHIALLEKRLAYDSLANGFQPSIAKNLSGRKAEHSLSSKWSAAQAAFQNPPLQMEKAGGPAD